MVLKNYWTWLFAFGTGTKTPSKLNFSKFLDRLSATVWETHPKKKIDFFRSTSHVDFLKAHIKISYLANFQNFWILPHWLAGVRRQRMGLKLTFLCIKIFSLKRVSFSQFLTKTIDSKTHFRAFFMLYTNQIRKIKKIFFWPYPTKN